jgi:3-deoxy-D-manno-octulosonic acid kinase
LSNFRIDSSEKLPFALGLTNGLDSFILNPMFKKIPIPSSFSLNKKGKTYLLLHNDYNEGLLRQGVEDLETFFKTHLLTTKYLNGRTPHPSIPIQDGMRIVIRKYSHGGLLRAFNRDLFLFGARSFKELSLTEEIRSSSIPTIQPIGAIHQIVFWPFYRAYLLSLELPHAKNLIQYFQENGSALSLKTLRHKRKTVRAAGLLLRQFHQKGFYHRDLQLKNLLVAEDQVLIIDFDRSYRKKALSFREMVKNLLRLNRSVEKWKRSGLPITRTDRLRFLLAYAGGDQEILKVLRRALRTFSMGLFFHRIGWTFEKVVRS